jgi:RHS repeat-associated protein
LVKFLFDKKDRQVMSQDALQATLNKWNFTKYDVFNRVVMSGELVHGQSQALAQTNLNIHPIPDESWNNGMGYDGASYPAALSPNLLNIQQYSFYDQYNFRDVLVPSFMFDATNAFHTNYSNVLGQKTGNLSYNSADHNKYYTTVNYYDNKARQIQSHATTVKSSSNNTNPTVTNLQYNFAGEEIYRLETANFAAPLSTQSTRTQTLRDHVGRPTLVRHGINTSSLTDLVSYTYDAIGRQTRKSLLPNGTFNAFGTLDYINRPPSPLLGTQDIARKAINLLPGTAINANYLGIINPNAIGGNIIKGLQHIDYAWHIRGGLKGMNLDGNGNFIPNTAEGDLFAFKLDYETAGFWDGNIGKQSWANVSQNIIENRNYTYNYDSAKRLKSASFAGLPFEDYSLPTISFDRNGNILNLVRKGKNGNTFQNIDNLSYFYQGNTLTGVTDAITGNSNVGDFRDNGSNADFTYWPDGSLKTDANKSISLITYNTFLSKVARVDYTDGRWLQLTYNGDGDLIRRQNSLGENWEYADGYIFKNGTYYQTISPEGRLVWEATNWNYEFNYTDNQDNLRVAFRNRNGNLEESQKATPDPWGLDIRPLSYGGADKNNYQFLKRETWDDIGWINLNKRFYMPDIGRFGQVDPVTDGQEQYSLYHYSRNNPVRFSDPEGDFCIPCITATVGAVVGAGINAYDQHKAGELEFSAKSIARIGTAAVAGGLAGSGLGGLGVAVVASAGGEVLDQVISKGKVDNLEKVAINAVATAATGGVLKGVEAIAVKSGIVAAAKSTIAANSTITILSNAGKVALKSNSGQNISTATATSKAVSEGTGNIVSYVAGNKVSNEIKPKSENKNGTSQFSVNLFQKPKFSIPFKSN